MSDGLILTKDDHLKWFEIVAFTDKPGFPGFDPANVSPPFKAQYFRGGEVEMSYPFFCTSDAAGRKNQSWTAGYEAYAVKRIDNPAWAGIPTWMRPPPEVPPRKYGNITHEAAAAIEKTLLSSENHGVAGGLMGAHMIDTYKAADGRTLINDYGNGWGTWSLSDEPGAGE